MIQIYGPKQSTAWRCFWMCEEVGLPYEMMPMDFSKGEHKSEAYLKLNPNGKVPTLVDGPFVLWESVAINAYLAEKHKPELLGSSIEDRAHVQQWGYWTVANLAHPVEVLVVHKWRPFPPEVLAKAAEDTKHFLGILEGCLAGKDYLVGNAFTLADLNVGSAVATAQRGGIDVAAYPLITAWFGKLAARPAFLKAAPQG